MKTSTHSISVLKNLRQSLKANADEKTQISGKRFFKEDVRIYGVKASVVHRLAKEHFVVMKGLPKQEVFVLCELLWQTGYLEESLVACDWAYRFCNEFQPADFLLFEKWVDQYVTNWASCDTFCNHSIGTFVEMYPCFVKELKRWAISPNLWKRRAAAVSLIIPARKGLFQKEIFTIAKILLHDTEDLVQKGYGWMLKVAGESDEQAVFRFVMLHKEIMPRTALRYAIEKMPKELKIKAMKK
jgi:3-methyladenine DNA glycosylase AlkD